MGRDCGETRTSHGGDTAEAQDGDSKDKRKKGRDRRDHRRDNSRAREADAAGAHAQRCQKTPYRIGEKKRRQKRKVAETEKGRQWTGHASRCANDGRKMQHEDPKPSPPRRKNSAQHRRESHTNTCVPSAMQVSAAPCAQAM